MNEKQNLLEIMSNEVDELNNQPDNTEDYRQRSLIMGLIIDHIDRNYNEDEEVIINAILALPEPLKALCEIFESYIDMDKVIEKVFKDYFLKEQTHKEAIKDCIYCDQFYGDEFCDDEEFAEDEEDEGFIHDNEDC